MYRLFVSLIFVTSVLGQITLNGTCNFLNISAVRDLNVTQLSGDWYQVRRIANTQEPGTCSTMSIKSTFNNSSLSKIIISNREVDNGMIKYRNGTISPTNIGNYGINGKFFLSFEDIAYDSIILTTNYTNYAVLYSCKNINNFTKNVWAWVLSRNATLNKNDEDYIQSVINGNDIQNATWISPEHSKKACEPNSSKSFGLSSVLVLLTVFIVGKDLFVSRNL